MNAKEMFEELGYKFLNEGKINRISFMKFEDFSSLSVDFYLDDKDYSVYKDTINHLYRGYVDIKLHQAITQQMKELGWIE